MLRSLLPKTEEGWLVLTCVVLGMFLIAAGGEIVHLNDALVTRPAVQDRVVTRTVRGPVRIVIKTIMAPDGTKTTEKTLDRAAVIVDKTIEHSEAPAQTPLARPRTRYAGLVIDPLRYAALPRLRAVLTMFKGSVDLGVSYDGRFPATAGAFGLETAWRF